MIASVISSVYGDDFTLSALSIDRRFACWTLEDETRYGPKQAGVTSIPAGTYPVELRTEGGFHERYSSRFPDIHRGMLWVRGAFDFKWVLLHCGNTVEDTRGCLLVGATPDPDGARVLDSTKAYRAVYPLLAEAAARGDLELRIVRATT